MSTIESRLDFINNHSAQCSKCDKKRQDDDSCELLGDSGASMTFTHSRNDLVEYERIINGPSTQTASKDATLQVAGKGTMFITHDVKWRSKIVQCVSCLYPVYLLPGLSVRLLSGGTLLTEGLKLQADAAAFKFKRNENVMMLYPHIPSQTIFWS